MNTFEDAFRVAVEKHMNKRNKEIESRTLHPLNLIKMIKGKNENEAAVVVHEFSTKTEETLGQVKNHTY